MKEKTIFQHEEGEKPLLRTAEIFKRAYEATVRVFAFTIGELSTSLPENDNMCQAALMLRPVASKLLLTIRDDASKEPPSEEELDDLLDSMITSGKIQMEVANSLGLLSLVRKIRTYRSLCKECQL